MPETRFSYVQSTIPAATLSRFPSLRGANTRNGDLIEGLYEELSNVSDAKTNPILAGATVEQANEALSFYNSVVEDGRYIALLDREPETAARLLDIAVSESALKLVKEGANIYGDRPEFNPIAVAVTVTTVGVAVTVAVVTKGTEIEEVTIESNGRIRI
jgi:hypothetical protein